jgi:hypothetical protein
VLSSAPVSPLEASASTTMPWASADNADSRTALVVNPERAEPPNDAPIPEESDAPIPREESGIAPV